MKKLSCTFLILILSALIPAEPYAQDADAHVPWMFTPEVCRGWYCYEREEKPAESQRHTPEAPHDTPAPFTGQVDWNAVWTMPSKQLSDLINAALSHAEQNPKDQKRMLTYLKLQGVAMRRAKAFQEAWSEAVLKYPLLDETAQRSPTTLGSKIEAITEREDRALAIGQMRADMGLIYFFSPECAYCERQKPILAEFMNKWQWKNFTAVDVSQNPKAIAEYGIQSVPDIWVVGNVKGKIERRRLKSGLADFSTLERGLLNAFSIWFKERRYERPETVKNFEVFEDFLGTVSK